MIHSIDSNNPHFKRIEFDSGFNIILAERTKTSTKKDSRNGLGKTTLINIIHFCLGGDPKDSLTSSKLNDWTFNLELDLNNKKYVISRNMNNTNSIFIDGDYSDWPIKPKFDADTGKYFLTKDSWRKILGLYVFDLPIGLPTFNPTFGSMISYFIRKPDGFLHPFKQSSSQQIWDIQTNNAYLLDLGWKYATEWQILRKKKNDLDAFKRELDTGKFSGFMGNIGELEAEKIRLDDKAIKEKEKINNFQISEQYERIEQDSNEITQLIHDETNQNIMDQLILDRYNSSLEKETDADYEMVSNIYREAGVNFSANITKTLDEVHNFHVSIVENRRDFLKSEIERLENNVFVRTQNIEKLDQKRSNLMQILKTHGALKEYTQIQTNYYDSLTHLNDIVAKLDNIKNIQEKSNQLKIAKQKLYQNALIDMKERTSQKINAVRIFGSFSSTLYDEFGTLSINLTENGFEFDIKIRRSSSQGIENMKVFCYDLTLAKIWSEKYRNPGFLIHDSMIFDGVDERQRAGALQLAKSTSESAGFQYICTLNSDMIPHDDLDNTFVLHDYVRRTLTDATADGGLLGIRI